MQIVIEISDARIQELVQDAAETVFATTRYEANIGGKLIKAQVEAWAKEQNFRPIIAELAPKVVAGVVRDTMQDVVRKAMTVEIKRMREDGELGLLAQRIINNEL